MGSRPRLMLQHGTPLSSRVVKGVSGLLLSSGRELELFLEGQQGSQTSIRVAQANSAIHSSHCRGIRPYLELRLESVCVYIYIYIYIYFLKKENVHLSAPSLSRST